jgi:hypothetical protein
VSSYCILDSNHPSSIELSQFYQEKLEKTQGPVYDGQQCNEQMENNGDKQIHDTVLNINGKCYIRSVPLWL